jgi:hypothetical protein
VVSVSRDLFGCRRLQVGQQFVVDRPLPVGEVVLAAVLLAVSMAHWNAKRIAVV